MQKQAKNSIKKHIFVVKSVVKKVYDKTDSRVRDTTPDPIASSERSIASFRA